MGEIIYWKKYDEPKMVYDPVRRKDVEVSGEFVCNDDRVAAFTIFGHMSVIIPGNQMYVSAEIVSKEMPNGKVYRERFTESEPKENLEEILIARAEEWLKNWHPENDLPEYYD